MVKETPPPSSYIAPTPFQVAQQQPSFAASMVTYLVAGVGVTFGIVFVRAMTGMEGEHEAPLQQQQKNLLLTQH